MSNAFEPGAQEAVAAPQPVIQKRQRPIGSERGEPQRQPRELDGHRVDVDAVETSISDRAPNGHALRLADVARMTPAVANERRFIRLRQEMARGYKKRSAAHRRVDDAKRQDVVRPRAVD